MLDAGVQKAKDDPLAAKRARAQEKREKVMSYIAEHRDKLERVVQRCLNRVLLARPSDPFSALVEAIGEYTDVGLNFTDFRAWPHDADNVCCEVVIAAHGANVVVQQSILPRALVARGLAGLSISADGGEKGLPPMSAEESEAASPATVSSRLSAAMCGVAADFGVLELQTLRSRLSDALGGSDELPALSLNDALTTVFLEAAGRVFESNPAEVVRQGLRAKGLQMSPPISCQDDLEAWEYRWPGLLLPALQGSTERRRLWVGLTAWAATLPDAAASIGDAEYVDFTAVIARRQAELEQAAILDTGFQDGDQQPDPDEFCPPLNVFTVMATLGNSIIGALTREGLQIPSEEDFRVVLERFRAAVFSALPCAEDVLPQPPPPEDVAEKEAGSEDLDDDLPHGGPQNKPYVSVSVKQQHASVYAALQPDADAAFNAEEEKYVFAAGGPERDHGELIAYYIELCRSEPSLRMIIEPFSKRDSGRVAGLERLRASLPEGVLIIGDLEVPAPLEAVPATDAPADEALADDSGVDGMAKGVEEGVPDDVADSERGNGSEDGRGGDLPGPSGEEIHDDEDGGHAGDPASGECAILGHPRDLRSGALNLLSHYASTVDDFVEAHGVYDLSACLDRPFMLQACLWVALALPENTRRFLLPKTGGLQELLALLKPLEQRLRAIFTAAYRRTKPVIGKGQALTPIRFRNGLTRLGFEAADRFSDPIFRFVDLSKGGTISANEMQILHTVKGPASVEDLDDFLLWLCGRAQQIRDSPQPPPAEGEENGGEAALPESPLEEFWRRMDDNNSGAASFDEFRSALKKMRYPGTAKNRGGVQELFLALDLKCNGVISKEEFTVLNVLSAKFQLQRVGRVRSFLQDHYGSGKSAFKALDNARRGMLNPQEWTDAMMSRLKYDKVHDVKVCFNFLDKDASGVLSRKEFEFLEAFSDDNFLGELQSFHDHIVDKFGSVDVGFDAFLPASVQAEEGSPAPQRLAARDFIAACRKCEFKGAYDPRLIFNFLDATHIGLVSRSEFSLVARLDAALELQKYSEFMREAVNALQDFAEGLPESQADDRDLWTVLHEKMLAATEDD